LFLNHDKLGRNFGCKCNQPANNKADDNNNKPIEPAYNSWFVRKPIVYHHWYTPANVILTGYVFPLLNAFKADSPKCGSQIECAIGLTFNGFVTHFSKLPCQATWNRFPEVHKKIIAR
jgi:hypothetical protein